MILSCFEVPEWWAKDELVLADKAQILPQLHGSRTIPHPTSTNTLKKGVFE
jgi:hypothetical protein